jgi:DNA-binding IclR family transcriptional regulator
VGKVVLAFGRGTQTEIPTQLTAFTPRTIIDPAKLAAAVAEVRERGWGEAEEEREEDLAAIAVPVFDHTGGLVAILGVQGPSDRFDANARRAALPALQTAARELGRLLGAI